MTLIRAEQSFHRRHALRALAVDFHDAVTGADARGYGGTVGHGAEHQKLLGLRGPAFGGSDADKLLIFEVVVELRFVGRADVIGVLVQRRFQDVAKFRSGAMPFIAPQKLQVVDRPVVAPGDEVEAISAQRRGYSGCRARRDSKSPGMTLIAISQWKLRRDMAFYQPPAAPPPFSCALPLNVLQGEILGQVSVILDETLLVASYGSRRAGRRRDWGWRRSGRMMVEAPFASPAFPFRRAAMPDLITLGKGLVAIVDGLSRGDALRSIPRRRGSARSRSSPSNAHS